METRAMPQSHEFLESPREWFTFERRNWIALVFVGALVGFWIGNGHTTQIAVQGLQAQAGCEHYVARTTAAIAKKAIVAANTDGVPAPNVKTIPEDNCPRK